MGEHRLPWESWALGTSTSLFHGFDEQSLIACQSAGVTRLEFVVGGSDPDRGAGYDPLAKRARELGLEIWSVHLPFGKAWDISSLDGAVRRQAHGWNHEILARAAEWGVKKAIIHPSFEPIPDAERRERLLHCSDSLHQLAEAASEVGVQIAVECLPRTCLGNTSDEILRLLEAHPALGVCCDVNHLLQETPQAFIARVGFRIVTLHISDYDGIDERHWLPGRGIIDWGAVIRQLAAAGYQGPFMFEVVNRRDAAEVVTPEALAACWNELKLQASSNQGGVG